MFYFNVIKRIVWQLLTTGDYLLHVDISNGICFLFPWIALSYVSPVMKAIF